MPITAGGYSPVSNQGWEVWGELFVTRRNRRGPGSEGREALARVDAAQALSGERRRQRSGPGPPRTPAPHARPAPHSTLLEEPARVRSQPHCLSFSEDVGCWEGASSAFLTEAGGSETCEQHRSSRWQVVRGPPGPGLRRRGARGVSRDAYTLPDSSPRAGPAPQQCCTHAHRALVQDSRRDPCSYPRATAGLEEAARRAGSLAECRALSAPPGAFQGCHAAPPEFWISPHGTNFGNSLWAWGTCTVGWQGSPGPCPLPA